MTAISLQEVLITIVYFIDMVYRWDQIWYKQVFGHFRFWRFVESLLAMGIKVRTSYSSSNEPRV